MNKHFIRRALAVCMLTALLLTIPAMAETADLSAPCSIKIDAGSSEFAEDIATAHVVVDLYRLASAESIEGSEMYRMVLMSPYDGESIAASMESGEYTVMAQEAAQVALAQGSPVVTGAELGQVISATSGGTGIAAGLYLLIARGSDIDDYVTTIQNDADEDTLVTVARSAEYEYLFSPQLLSIPIPEEQDDEADADDEITWLYDLNVSLKFDRRPMFGTLEIVKTLLSYTAEEPATFVFSVDATLDGEVSYSNVAALTFTAPGTLTAVIDRIPLGSSVRVEEVYSGSHYVLQSAAIQTAAVEKADEPTQVFFVNTYDETATGGYGIDNHFTYDGETWEWVQLSGGNEG